MTPEQNITAINAALNDYITENGKTGKPARATLVFMHEFGGVRHGHVTLVKSEIIKYAQYDTALRIYFKNKNGRTVMYKIFHEGNSFAVFEGWRTAEFDCNTEFYSSFDRNNFYTAVDAMDGGRKLGEESERLYIAERTAMPKIYEVISRDADGFHREEFGSADELGAAYEITGKHEQPGITRAELQGAPILKLFCGPMYNGTRDGAAVIRYESAAVYDMMSN